MPGIRPGDLRAVTPVQQWSHIAYRPGMGLGPTDFGDRSRVSSATEML
jgi:hypothetical protein